MSLGEELRSIDGEKLTSLLRVVWDKETLDPQNEGRETRRTRYPGLTRLHEAFAEYCMHVGMSEDEAEIFMGGVSATIINLVEYAEVVETESALPQFPIDS